MDNAINYTTPNFGGFSAELAYGLGEVPGSTSRGSQYGFAASYDKAPFTAVLAYHRQNLVAGVADAGDARSWLVGGAYDFKVAKLHAAYADNRDENAFGTATSRSRDYMLGVSAPVGPLTVMASYIRHDERGLANADADYWGIGATYDLSKRTNFYASYSTINNDALASLGSGAAGVDIRWINVGIRHRF
jgi:predicted porin